MDNVIGDIRYAARVLRRNPVFTAVAILTLALGIGANTAVFNVMNAVLLRYLPVPDPERVVYLRVEGRPSGTWETGDDSLTFNEPAFEQMRGERRVLSDLVAFVPLGFGPVAVRSGDEPEVARGDMVSGNFFSGLGVRLARGRGFTLDDERRHTQVVVLS